MIRYLIILCNAFTVFLMQLLTPDEGIVVKGNFPATMTAGAEVPVELVITKGAMGGFAKLQLELPEGFVVKEAEEAGASYTFADGIAKWVWATLPSEPEILIKLTLIPSASSIGAKTIAAKYSYVENNQKQSVEMTPAEVMVVGPDGAVPTYAAVSPESTVSAAAPDSSAAASQTAVSSSAEPPHDVQVERVVSQGTALNEFIVSIKVRKGATKGFARYSDDLPSGLTAKGLYTEGGSFSVSEGKLKFVWVNVPEKEILDISYSLSGNPTEAVVLKGEYSYLENNQSKKVVLPEEPVTFQPPVATEENKENQKTETTEEPASVATTTPEPVAQVPAKSGEEMQPAEPAKTLSAPTANAYYAVQIGAFKKRKVTAQKLEKKFSITEPIRSEMQGGFSKFLVGNHPDYKEARDHRENVKTNNKVKSA